MSKHPLEVIERLIDVELKSRAYTRDEFEGSFIPTLKTTLHKLWQNPLSEDLNKHLRFCQYSLIRLMDTVANYLSVEERKNLDEFNEDFDLCDCYKMIFNCFKKYFIVRLRVSEKYMDIDYQVPAFYFEIDEEKVQADLRSIRDKLIDDGVDGNHWSIFRQTFSVLFSANIDNRISYRQLLYLMELQKRFNRLLKDEDDFLRRLQIDLIYLNFNDPLYAKYAIALIRKEIDEMPAIHERLIRLQYLRREMQLVIERSGFNYQPFQSSLKNQLLHCINEKIILLEADPRELMLSALEPKTAKLIRLATDMKMSERQLNRLLEMVIEKDFYKNNKQGVDYMFSRYCATIPEDNPEVNKLLSILRIAKIVTMVKSRLWF